VTNQLRPKYQYLTRVKGTPYFVSASTWIDEFSQPAKAIMTKMEQLQKKYSEEYNKRFGLLLFILVAVMIVLFIVIFFLCFLLDSSSNPSFVGSPQTRSAWAI